MKVIVDTFRANIYTALLTLHVKICVEFVLFQGPFSIKMQEYLCQELSRYVLLVKYPFSFCKCLATNIDELLCKPHIAELTLKSLISLVDRGSVLTQPIHCMLEFL